MDKTKNSVKTANGQFSKERRRFVRHLINFPLTYRILGTANTEIRSKTVNISRGGLLFTAREPANELSRVMIKIPFQDRIYTVKGKVVHCRPGLDKRCYEIGISFYSLSDIFKTKLVEQLYLIREFRDLKSRRLGKKISLEKAAREWVGEYSKDFNRFYR